MMSPSKNRATSLLTWFGSFVLVISFVIVLADAGTALASNVSYVGSDGNVWRVTPDGSKREQLTTDATADLRYKTPSQKNDGTVVAIRRAGPDSGNYFAHFFRPSDKQMIDSWLLPKTGAGSFAPFNGGVISPDGGAFFYDWRYFDCWTNPCTGDLRVSVITGPGVTNPCLVNCHRYYLRPRWIPGTPYAGFVDEDFNAIWVQGEGQAEPRRWLGFSDRTAGDVHSFDVSADGRSVLELTAEGGDRSEFAFWDNNGTPPAGEPTPRCTAVNVAKAPAYPRFSPDGKQITWQGEDGVYVAPVPTQADGGGCSLDAKKIADGGIEPSWGAASLKGDGPGPDPNPDPDPKPGENGSVRIASLPASAGTVKAGRAATLKVAVAAGAKDVPAVKVCGSVPRPKRKVVKVGCKGAGTIPAGARKAVRLKVKTTAKARGRYRIAVRVTGSGVAAKSGATVLKVRG